MIVVQFTNLICPAKCTCMSLLMEAGQMMGRRTGAEFYKTFYEEGGVLI